MSNPTPTPSRNAFGQPVRPLSPAQKRRAAAWAPFLKPVPKAPTTTATKGQTR